MQKDELHLSIVWSKAENVLQNMIDEIAERFEIKKVYKIFWERNKFLNNLRMFYSHSQYHLSEKSLSKLMKMKGKHCGTDPFFLIIFSDKHPIYQLRNTTSGKRKVNINIFDLKQKYRDISGGGHKIHGTDFESETNKDLSLLLGMNLVDFKNTFREKWDGKTEEFHRNIVGLDGYKNFRELFYILNASIKYIVLRNFEELLDSGLSLEHNDVDILVENLNFIVYLTGAKKIQKSSKRVQYEITIDNKPVLFDFRYLGDNYYDIKWEKDLLENRIFIDNTFYAPDKTNYFYSLLYHALVHKSKLSSDYQGRLVSFAERSDISFKGCEESEFKLCLLDYLGLKQYQIKEPSDYSVYFNHSEFNYQQPISFSRKKILLKSLISTYYKKLKKKIYFLIDLKEKLDCITWIIFNYFYFKKYLKKNYGLKNIKIFNFGYWHRGASYFTAYSTNNNEKLFIKTDWFNRGILDNEYKMYQLCKENNIQDKISNVYEKGSCKGFTFIIQEFFNDYVSLDNFLKISREVDAFSKEEKEIIIDELYDFLLFMHKEQIVHRDLRPDNIMVNRDGKKLKIKIIDFSFVIDSSQSNKKRFIEIKPSKDSDKIWKWLGDVYKPSIYRWDDAFSINMILKDLYLEGETDKSFEIKNLISVNFYKLM